jgi:hypothetical protein
MAKPLRGIVAVAALGEERARHDGTRKEDAMRNFGELVWAGLSYEDRCQVRAGKWRSLEIICKDAMVDDLFVAMIEPFYLVDRTKTNS